MKLSEVAARMAEGLQMELKDVADAAAHLAGRHAEMRITPYFGGWQIEVRLPERPVYQFFEEDVRMMVQRVDARLRHYQQELEAAEAQKRPGR